MNSEAKFKFIFNHITDLIMVCNPDFSITESNDPANIVLGKGESIIGERCHRVVRQNKKQCVDCPLNDTINSGTIIPLVKYDNRFNEYFEERSSRHSSIKSRSHLKALNAIWLPLLSMYRVTGVVVQVINPLHLHSNPWPNGGNEFRIKNDV